MSRAKYRVKDNNGSGIYVTLPSELAHALGIKDFKGGIKLRCVRFELGFDDSGPYGIIRAVDDD